MNRTIASLFTVLAVALIRPAPALAHMPVAGGPSVMLSRDQPSGTRAYGVESNVAFAFFNTSLALRHWENDVTGWNGRRLHNEASLYLGVGILNVIQIQRGFSNAGTRNRVRADIVLSERFPFPSEEKWGRFSKGIVITPFVESESGRKVYGFGIGLALD